MLLNSRPNKQAKVSAFSCIVYNKFIVYTIKNYQFHRLSQRHFSSIRYISSLGSTCKIKRGFLQYSVFCKYSGKSKSVDLWSASSQWSTHLDCPNNNLVVKTITDQKLALSMASLANLLNHLSLIRNQSNFNKWEKNISFLWRNPSLPKS